MAMPSCIPMTETTFATVSSIFTIGGLVGALAAGPICSQSGRLVSMRITALLYLLGSAIETLATTVPVLGLGRILNGASAGASTVIVPLYISEVAPAASRGFFGSFTQITVNVGILLTQTLGYFLSYGSAWRWILVVGILLAGLHVAGLLLVPESPTWLATQRGDVVKARRILVSLRGRGVSLDEDMANWPTGNGTNAPPSVVISRPAEEQGLLDQGTLDEEAQVDNVQGQADLANSESLSTAPPTPKRAASVKGAPAAVGFFQVLVDARYRSAIIAVIGIMVAQQTCGINSVIMYSVSLLNGMLPVSSGLLTILISAVNLVTTMACSPLPDRLGRKTCLLLSTIGQGLSSLALALSIVFGVKILSAISVLLFVAFFAVGLGPVPFLIASELVGPEAVGATQSWALGSNYIATFLVAQFFPMINAALNARFGGAGWVYFLFGGFAAVWAVFLVFCVPETRGKLDADEVWGRTQSEHID